MDAQSIETYITDQLNLHFNNPTIDETLITHWSGVEVYANFLISNLEYTFHTVCNTFDNSMLQSINDINFPFRSLNIEFTIEVFNKDYLGRFTAFCPELIGCITEGNTKMEALNNLCFAIAEVLNLNYEFLKVNPLTLGASSPKVTKNFFVASPDSYSYNFSKILYIEGKYNRLYLSKKHLLLKNDNYPKITLTLPHSGFQELTRHLLKRIAGLE